MSTSKIGFHIAANCGGCTGLVDLWQTLDQAGINFGVYAANDPGKIASAVTFKYANPIIYRDVEASTVNPADYAMAPDKAAIKYWAKQQIRLPQEIKAARARTWIELFNEPGKDQEQAGWVGAVMAQMARLALAEGYRVCGPGWSAGTPEPFHWELPGWRDYLSLCAANPDKVAVSLHEYSFDNDIFRLEGWLIGRFKFLFAACDKLGIKRPTTLITECGWTLNSMPPDAQARMDIEYLARLYAAHRDIQAVFLWTLQSGAGNGDLPQRLNALIPWLTKFTLETRFPDPAPEEPPMTTLNERIWNYSVDIQLHKVPNRYGLQLNPNAALQQRIKADGGSGLQIVTEEFTFESHAGQAAEDAATGKRYVYYAPVGQYSNVTVLHGKGATLEGVGGPSTTNPFLPG
jgi:hypothetical protein